MTLLKLDDPIVLLRELRNYVALNFFSNDTVQDENQDGPEVIREEPDYLYGHCLEGDTDCDPSVGRKLAANGGRSYLFPGRGAVIDEAVADEQFKHLAPLAVRYTASVIRYFRDVAGSDPCPVSF